MHTLKGSQLQGEDLKASGKRWLHIGVCYVTTIWALKHRRLIKDTWKDNQKDRQAGKHNGDTVTRQTDRSKKSWWVEEGKWVRKLNTQLHSVCRAKLISLFLMPLSADSIKKYTVMMICVLLSQQRERSPLIPHECYNWHLIALG